LFYLPPSEFWYLTVARLAVSFDDGKDGMGTGFFVFGDGQYFLVTARHVVDPTYLPNHKKRHASCQEMEVAFQCAVNPGTPNAGFGYQRLRVSDPNFRYEENDVDVAVIRIPKDTLPLRRGGDLGSGPIKSLAGTAIH